MNLQTSGQRSCVSGVANTRKQAPNGAAAIANISLLLTHPGPRGSFRAVAIPELSPPHRATTLTAESRP
jgi:hypothetical protein